MKRGKDEEKILEPMFPRLHVNDADKGGPRAPPRNKMALYEQFSIPSQKFTNHDTNTLIHPVGSTSQPCGMERNSSAQHLDSAAAIHETDKLVSRMSFIENVRSLAQHDQRKRVREEYDFSVPVFINSRRFQLHDRTKSGSEKVKESVKLSSIVNSLDISVTEEINLEKSTSRVNNSNASLRQESRNMLDRDGGETRGIDIDNGVESHLETESHSEEGHGSLDNGRKYCRSRGYTFLQQINEDASDTVTVNLMVDSISSIDVSPDDVAGVLGQKRFWRARKAIANQQRVFAVQLFELHRLIKVQRLIAASPDFLLEDINYLGKVSAKSYPIKKLLGSEFVVEPPLPEVIVKHRGDSGKTDQHKMECSDENVVGRFSNQTHHQPSNYTPPLVSNLPDSQTLNGGYFPPQHPPSGGNQQWLIPVMSPSEGLIYKPHPSLGHTGPVCGGYYGHFMPAPMMLGSFMGGGQPPFHPGVGFPSPYGMMNPYCSSQQQQQPNEQMDQFNHLGNLHNVSASNTQQPSSVNEAATPQQPVKSYPKARKSRQGSTGSCPNEPEGISGNNNAPEQMMTTTTTRTTVTETTRDGGVTRVIKVVPHNAKLASENAARIFRSIQEERKRGKLYDSCSNHT